MSGQVDERGRWVEPVVLLDVPFRPNVEMMRDIAKRLGWGQPAPGPSAMWAKLEPPSQEGGA